MMTCAICGNFNCCKSFHTMEAQLAHDRGSEPECEECKTKDARIAELEAERDNLRQKNRGLNRRAQTADAATADAKQCLDKLAAGIESGTPWCDGSLGRKLLAWNAQQQDQKIAGLEEAVDKLLYATSFMVGRCSYDPSMSGDVRFKSFKQVGMLGGSSMQEDFQRWITAYREASEVVKAAQAKEVNDV